MALILSELKLPLNAEESSLKEFAARALAMPESAIHTLRINRISLDARKKEDICFTYTVTVGLSEKDEARVLRRSGIRIARAPEESPRQLAFGSEPLKAPIVVVGLGPAGILRPINLPKTDTARLYWNGAGKSMRGKRMSHGFGRLAFLTK